MSFSNDFHEALSLSFSLYLSLSLSLSLSHKSGNDFWNSWRSKFGTANKQPYQINGLVNEKDVANKFADFFNKHALSIPNCVILN